MATRRERVILELEDLFSRKMMGAATSTEVLRRELNSLSGQSVVTARSTATINKEIDETDRSARKSSDSINQLTGRLSLLADLLKILGPTVSSLGAVGLQGLMGFANQAGVAALAGISALTAFQGVGAALEAVNKAALEPTADNLAAAREELDRLSPAAVEAVMAMQGFRPALAAIRNAGAEGLFPGFVQALETMERRAPDVARVVASLNTELGELMSGGAASLAGSEWDEFFDFLATDARDTLADLGATVGNLSRGLAELWMASDPLTDDFNASLRESSETFAEWADRLSQTDGYAEFVAFTRESGPQVADTLLSIADAGLQIVEATAPISGPVLRGLEALADIVGAIADSNMGTPILAGAAALAVLNRTLAVTAAISARAGAGLTGGGMLGLIGMSAGGKGLSQASASLKAARSDVSALAATWATAGARSGREMDRISEKSKSLRTNLGATARAAAPAGAAIAGIGLASSGVADDLGMANTASMALMGTMFGPLGTAAGAAVGAFMDVKAGADNLRAGIEALDLAMESGDASAIRARTDELREQQAEIEKVSGAFQGKFQILNATGVGQAAIGIDAAKGLWAELSGAADEAEAKIAEGEQAIRDAEAAAVQAAYAAAGATDSYTYSINANIAAMNAKRDAALAAENAELGYRSAVTSAQEALDRNKKATDLTTRAGQENRQALLGMVGAWNNLADSGGATEKQMRQARREIIRIAEDMGYGKEEAGELAAAMHGIPDVDVKVKLNAQQTWDELTRLERFRFDDKTITVRTVGDGNKGGPFLPKADGGIVEYYANGGVRENHVAQIAPAGAMRLWAEPETGGEAYIPLAPSKRERSLKVWARTGEMLGALSAFANGGFTGDGTNSSVAKDNREVARSLKELAKELKATTSELADARQKRKAAGEAAVSPFDVDLFGQGDIWSGAAGNPIAAAKDMTAQLRQRRRLTRQLRKAGLNGDELAMVLEQADTNEDLSGILERGEAKKLDRVLTGYAKERRQTERVAGDAAYGAEIRRLNKTVNDLRDDLKKRGPEKRREDDERAKKQAKDTGKAFAEGINSASTRGAAGVGRGL